MKKLRPFPRAEFSTYKLFLLILILTYFTYYADRFFYSTSFKNRPV